MPPLLQYSTRPGALSNLRPGAGVERHVLQASTGLSLKECATTLTQNPNLLISVCNEYQTSSAIVKDILLISNIKNMGRLRYSIGFSTRCVLEGRQNIFRTRSASKVVRPPEPPLPLGSLRDRHPREGGNPLVKAPWTPAFAGVTGLEVSSIWVARRSIGDSEWRTRLATMWLAQIKLAIVLRLSRKS